MTKINPKKEKRKFYTKLWGNRAGFLAFAAFLLLISYALIQMMLLPAMSEINYARERDQLLRERYNARMEKYEQLEQREKENRKEPQTPDYQAKSVAISNLHNILMPGAWTITCILFLYKIYFRSMYVPLWLYENRNKMLQSGMLSMKINSKGQRQAKIRFKGGPRAIWEKDYTEVWGIQRNEKEYYTTKPISEITYSPATNISKQGRPKRGTPDRHQILPMIRDQLHESGGLVKDSVYNNSTFTRRKAARDQKLTKTQLREIIEKEGLE